MGFHEMPAIQDLLTHFRNALVSVLAVIPLYTTMNLNHTLVRLKHQESAYLEKRSRTSENVGGLQDLRSYALSCPIFCMKAF